MFILGFTCLFLSVVVGIMAMMALAARGIAKEKAQEAEREAAERENEESRQ